MRSIAPESVLNALWLVSVALWCPSAFALMEDAPPLYNWNSGQFSASYSGPTSYSGGAIVEMPEVTITGKGDSRTVCIGSACATFIRSLIPANNYNKMGNLPIDNLVKEKIAQAIAVSACSILPGMPADARSITKFTDDVIRWRIGSQIINAHLNHLRLIALNKQEFQVTYSDGSKETFTYVTMSSNHAPKADSLVGGDGVPGSAC